MTAKSAVRLALTALLTLAAPTTVATAQGLLTTHGRVVVAEGMAVPGVPGAIFSGTISTIGIDQAVLDPTGRVLFRGRISGGGATATDDRGYFAGFDASDLQLVLRGGSAAPSLPGLTLNTATAQGLGASPRLAPDGGLLFGSALSGPAVSTTNDSALFLGFPPSSVFVAAREGDPAPGTAGAVFASNFADPSYSTTGATSGLNVLFTATLSGGDVVGTTNNSALYAGVPPFLQTVRRKGDVVSGGQVVSTLGFVAQMNASGEVAHDVTYSTTTGFPAATTANDRALYVFSPTAGDQLLVREGDAAPGTIGATFNNASNSWAPSVSANAFNAAGKIAFLGDLLGGDTTVGVNDRGVFVMGIGSSSLVVRKGATTPGVPGGVFSAFGNGSLQLNASDAVFFHGTASGVGITTANDTGLWTGTAGNLTLVAREGDVAPGAGGGTFLNIQSNIQIAFNDRGQATWVSNVMIGGNPTSCLFGYDPNVGVTLLLASGEALEVLPGVFKNVVSLGFVNNNNGGGSPLCLSPTGDLVVRATMADATGSTTILRGNLGALWAAPRTLSTATGGVQTLYLNAGLARASEVYFLAGSGSGSVPGFTFGSFLIPLNPDPYFDYTINFPNLPPLGNTLAFADLNGRSIATFTLPPGLGILAGLSVDHAYLTLDAFLNPTLVSEAAVLSFTP
jgi:hypothetical protein